MAHARSKTSTPDYRFVTTSFTVSVVCLPPSIFTVWVVCLPPSIFTVWVVCLPPSLFSWRRCSTKRISLIGHSSRAQRHTTRCPSSFHLSTQPPGMSRRRSWRSRWPFGRTAGNKPRTAMCMTPALSPPTAWCSSQWRWGWWWWGWKWFVKGSGYSFKWQ